MPPPDSLAGLMTQLTPEERRNFTLMAEATRSRAAEIVAAARAAAAPEERQELIGMLARGPQAGSDAAIERVFASGAEGRQAQAMIACRKGCSHCCYINILITIPEAVQIAAALRSGAAGPASAELTAAVKRTAPRIARLGAKDRQAKSVACAFLVDDSCAIYGLRPNACRAHFSTDATRCAASLETARTGGADVQVPTLAFPQRISLAYNAGVVRACADAGLQSCIVELTEAVNLLLVDETAFGRWLNGDAVFQPVA